MWIRENRTSLCIGAILGILMVVGARPLAAGTVLLPIVYGAHGANDASWITEVRITNRTDVPKQFSIVDWIGTPGWKASSYTIAPRSTTSLGGAGIFGTFVPLTGAGAVGLAVCEAENGLLVQSAVLSGLWRSGGVSYSCQPYDGGGFSGVGCPGPAGAGPIIEGLAFSDPGKEIYLPWLHTVSDRRTNLVLINPDSVVAHVEVSVQSQDGLTTKTEAFDLEPRSYNQLSDVFAAEPWSTIRSANIDIGGGAASATIVSDTRLLAMATVISNYNNSLSIALPR
jgi:hypothetical protein